MPHKPRFLITTSDKRTWRAARPVLFLGEWCRLESEKTSWAALDSEVVPDYGWAEGQRESDYAYTRELCERLLEELSDALNGYHETNHTRRYWQILIGTWLSPFVAIAFNRWSTIHMALKEFDVSGSIVLDHPIDQTIPNSSYDFPAKYVSQDWNHALIGRLLTGWTDVKCEKLAVEPEVDPAPTYSMPASFSLKPTIRSLIAGAGTLFSKMFARPTDAFFVATYLPLLQDFRLQLALGQVPKRWQVPDVPFVKLQPEARRRFCLNSTEYRGFEQCIRTLVSEQIPRIYLEGYQTLLEQVSELPWPRLPRLIFTSNSFHSADVFKAWAAAKVEEGVPYFIGQHGGYYGIGKYLSHSATNEYATADRFLTWGWNSEDPKHYLTAALTLVGRRRKWRAPGNKLLQVLVRYFRYTRDPWSIHGEYLDYTANQLAYASYLPDRIRSELIVRFHASSWSQGYPPELVWRTRHPDVKLDMGTDSFEAVVRRTRLVVATYNSTIFLETLGQNIPTIMFWNPKYNELMASAMPYFDVLRGAGIFHTSAKSAAAKTAEVWDDVDAWWNQPAVQAARRTFCERFARVPENPINVLKHALIAVKRQS